MLIELMNFRSKRKPAHFVLSGPARCQSRRIPLNKQCTLNAHINLDKQ